MADNKLFGTNYTTPDLVAKVTGKAKYAEDFKADGMLFAKLLLSPMPHARVVSIDTSAAEAMPGVKAILRWKDLPGPVPGQTLGEGWYPTAANSLDGGADHEGEPIRRRRHRRYNRCQATRRFRRVSRCSFTADPLAAPSCSPNARQHRGSPHRASRRGRIGRAAHQPRRQQQERHHAAAAGGGCAPAGATPAAGSQRCPCATLNAAPAAANRPRPRTAISAPVKRRRRRRARQEKADGPGAGAAAERLLEPPLRQARRAQAKRGADDAAPAAAAPAGPQIGELK